LIRVFADSFYLLALFNGRDAAHEQAVAASKELQGRLVTTDWVLAETADALSAPPNRALCAKFIDDLRHSAHVEVEAASRESFDAGLKLYRERLDKDWSLTDCISFVVMSRSQLTDALTGDHHFEQAGFRALLK
jgi:uncharacterized protein